MPTIRLSRPAPLTPEELAALPPEAKVSDSAADERLTLDLPLPELLQIVYELGGIVPACRLTLDAELTSMATEPAEPDLGTDPWKLVDAGDPRAEKLFTAPEEASEGRRRAVALK